MAMLRSSISTRVVTDRAHRRDTLAATTERHGDGTAIASDVGDAANRTRRSPSRSTTSTVLVAGDRDDARTVARRRPARPRPDPSTLASSLRRRHATPATATRSTAPHRRSTVADTEVVRDRHVVDRPGRCGDRSATRCPAPRSFISTTEPGLLDVEVAVRPWPADEPRHLHRRPIDLADHAGVLLDQPRPAVVGLGAHRRAHVGLHRGDDDTADERRHTRPRRRDAGTSRNLLEACRSIRVAGDPPGRRAPDAVAVDRRLTMFLADQPEACPDTTSPARDDATLEADDERRRSNDIGSCIRRGLRRSRTNRERRVLCRVPGATAVDEPRSGDQGAQRRVRHRGRAAHVRA